MTWDITRCMHIYTVNYLFYIVEPRYIELSSNNLIQRSYWRVELHSNKVNMASRREQFTWHGQARYVHQTPSFIVHTYRLSHTRIYLGVPVCYMLQPWAIRYQVVCSNQTKNTLLHGEKTQNIVRNCKYFILQMSQLKL